jgi:uncharacterized membrane protein YoaK (UPF0700 family)
MTRGHAGTNPASGPATARAAAIRDALVATLAATAGAVDATAFLALGKVFASVMTGNLVLLGVAAGDHSGSQAIHGAVAIAACCAGLLVGAPLAARGRNSRGGQPDQVWAPTVTQTLLVELCLLITFTIGWELSPRPHGNVAQLVLLVLLSAAMGLQSAAVRRLGPMSSTYLTSTLIAVISALATRTKLDGMARSVAALGALTLGALAAGLLVRFAPAWVPAAALAPFVAVIGVAATAFRRPA